MRRREFFSIFSAAAAWPVTLSAQPAAKIPTIGVLWHAGSPEEEQPYFRSLIDGFRDVGYVDGQNITFVHRFPNEIPERFRDMAIELASLHPNALVSVGNLAAPYLKQASGNIPYVFTIVPDPLALKLVNNLARPGSNVTGFSTVSADLVGKRVQLLKEMLPKLSRFGLLINPDEMTAQGYANDVREAAAKLGLQVQVFEARNRSEVERVFPALVSSGMEALFINGGGLFFQMRRTIGQLAVAHRLPSCVWSREVLEAGALMAYGTDQVAVIRRVGVYVDKILKGTKPGDLPVEQPTKFLLTINLSTAKALGLEVPLLLQQRADEVIE